MRLVFDTNILISSTLWDNSVSHKLLIRLIEKDAEVFTSLEILEEYKKAVMRDFKYTEEEVNDVLTKLLNFLKVIKPEIKIDAIKEDLDDNKILECAVASNSEFIISYDNHLLKFKEFKGIKIMTLEECLNQIE